MIFSVIFCSSEYWSNADNVDMLWITCEPKPHFNFDFILRKAHLRISLTQYLIRTSNFDILSAVIKVTRDWANFKLKLLPNFFIFRARTCGTFQLLSDRDGCSLWGPGLPAAYYICVHVVRSDVCCASNESQKNFHFTNWLPVSTSIRVISFRLLLIWG